MYAKHRDTLYKLHATCGAQYTGNICDGHSVEGTRGTSVLFLYQLEIIIYGLEI